MPWSRQSASVWLCPTSTGSVHATHFRKAWCRTSRARPTGAKVVHYGADPLNAMRGQCPACALLRLRTAAQHVGAKLFCRRREYGGLGHLGITNGVLETDNAGLCKGASNLALDTLISDEMKKENFGPLCALTGCRTKRVRHAKSNAHLLDGHSHPPGKVKSCQLRLPGPGPNEQPIASPRPAGTHASVLSDWGEPDCCCI